MKWNLLEINFKTWIKNHYMEPDGKTLMVKYDDSDWQQYQDDTEELGLPRFDNKKDWEWAVLQRSLKGL